MLTCPRCKQIVWELFPVRLPGAGFLIANMEACASCIDDMQTKMRSKDKPKRKPHWRNHAIARRSLAAKGE